MYIKIYFGDKPVFLCDEIDPTIHEYLHHPDAIFIDEINNSAIKSLMHEIKKNDFHAGILWHPDLEKLKKAFWKHFKIVLAAGGWVVNEKDEILFIFRRGKWDLPKGKLDNGEKLEECAQREVREETGLQHIKLKDKIIIVSGGAKGIGEGIVKVLAAEGATPVIIGRSEEDNLKVVNELGGKAAQFVAELTDPAECERSVKAVIAKFGRIDGLVNNAGVNDGVGLEKGDYERFIASIHKNLVHYYLLAHYALPELKKSKGVIVNIGSKTAETGQGNTSAYAAANGGRNALTREWAVELLPYGIRVNAIIVAECWTPLYENWIKTLPNPEEKLKSIKSKIPLEQRMTTAEEIANMAAFLLSEKSSHTTGQLIHVDGGYVHLDRAIS